MSHTITGHTGFMGLLGDPVAHSISPQMHNMAFQLLNLDYVYLCFPVGENELPTAVQGLKACKIRGFNLTMPNKNRMAELCDHLSPAAELIGAVNTVVNDNGILTGHNTDGTGFLRSLKEAGCPVAGSTITLMGAGGAATAICTQAALDGAKTIHIFARPTSRFWKRTEELAQELTRRTSCPVVLMENDDETALASSLKESQILINGTSVGMAPNTESSIIEDSSLLDSHLTVADVIYNPRETRLLAMARERGCRTLNGMYMLLYQGAEAFRLWTGLEMPVDEIRAHYFT